MVGRWVAKLIADSNIDISQKYKTSDISKGVATKLKPAKKYFA
jgi:hypothetical protein